MEPEKEQQKIPEEVEEEEEFAIDDTLSEASLWVVTRAQLGELVTYDRTLVGQQPKNPAPLVARLYARYIRCLQRLDAVWNETLQVQKSDAMRRLLDAAVVRLGELKELLTTINISEFHYIDGALIELKLIPRDIELIPLTAYPLQRDGYLQDLAQRLYRGERIYTEPVEEAEEVPEQEENIEEVAPKKTTKRPVIDKIIDPRAEQINLAILVIQPHERARQGRLEFFDEKTAYDLKQIYEQPKRMPREISNPFATVIQKYWRGYKVRQMIKNEDLLRTKMICMDVPSWFPKEWEAVQKEKNDKIRLRREQKVREYIDTCCNEKIRCVRVVAPGLAEDIGEEIRWWFRNWYDVAKAFDKYPDEEAGGTIMVIRGETMTPEVFRVEQERLRKEREKLKANPELAKKAKAEALKKKKQAMAKARKEKARLKREKLAAKKNKNKKKPEEPFTFKDSPALELVRIASEQFDENWTPVDEETRIEMDNDNPLMYKITNDKMYEVQLETRIIVDEMMRLELELLNAARERDRTAGKKGKKKKEKKKKKKKGKKGKKGKKDPTGKRTTEDLFQELYDNGIIRKYPARDINHFIGDYSYKNMELRLKVFDPLPSVGDIRQAIINNCIIPLSGEMVPKPKSVCIFGPRGSGKKYLVDAICTATDAVLFDLSPPVLVGKYPGKKGMKMLLHLINKMSRILQPSVIFVEGAEKMYYRKVPKLEKKFEPKRMKKGFFKGIVKTLLPADRVMAIATSREPWNCAISSMVKCYDKFIMIPRTDYGTVYQLWMDCLMAYHGVHRDLDVSALAMATVGYPIPVIQETIEKVLNASRLIRLKYEPLTQHEILENIICGDPPEPVLPQEQDKFTNWYNKKTKLGKARQKIVKLAAEARAEAEKQKEKAKAKK